MLILQYINMTEIQHKKHCFSRWWLLDGNKIGHENVKVRCERLFSSQVKAAGLLQIFQCLPDNLDKQNA